MATLIDLTDEQRIQHQAVLNVASHNLDTLIDQLQTLDSTIYDEILDSLDIAREALTKRQTTLKELTSNG